jgi:hypothetical protein
MVVMPLRILGEGVALLPLESHANWAVVLSLGTRWITAALMNRVVSTRSEGVRGILSCSHRVCHWTGGAS